jgi:single-stranded-DNA-specific exonuclease
VAATVSSETFLGVESSLTGRRWLTRDADDRSALALAQRLDLPEVVGRILAARDVGIDDAEAFLNPTLRASLPDPDSLKGMAEAVERLASAIMQGERIAVFGDYDVDGATSSALLRRYFSAVGSDIDIYIPDRRREGYGPNAEAMLGLREKGASVVVTVDCGTGAHEALAAAADAGLDVIVVDHHVAEAKLPPAVAIINPNRLDESGMHGELAAVGVAFLLLIGLNRALRGAGWFDRVDEPDLLGWLDLVALGTICDVAPLTGINRALVTQGLKVMSRRGNPGLKALADIAGISEVPGAYHAGFVLGPRVNAGGRVGQSDLGARLLSTGDAVEAADLAGRLDEFNRERQTIEAAVLDDALERLGSAPEGIGPLVFAAGDGWHPGVIGIVASRLKERFNRPACVVALDGDTGLGSGRSVRGVDLGATVIAARQAGILSKGGGHAMAAGFSVARGRLDDLRAFLEERVAAVVAETGIESILMVDGAIKVGGASLDLIQAIEQVGPFGAGNPEPRFAIAGARIAHAAVAGSDHVRCAISSETGGRLKAIAFRCLDSDLGPALLRHDGAPFHIVGRLRLDTWQGREQPQFLIDDAAPAWSDKGDVS